MNKPPSLGVIIPTRNCAHLIQPALPALHAWLDLAAGVVVVDSFSTDGTLELLRRELKHPNVKFLSHPPGLYQSWNFGISQLNTDYVNISTAGDTLTREGITRLLETATTLQCDVVISKPQIKDLNGEPYEVEWPMDDIIRSLNITAPRRLTRREALLFAGLNPSSALTGSCASDIFRTACLKQFPFSPDFGNSGDCAWCLSHVAEVTWGVVPGQFSTFLRHPTTSTEIKNIDGAKPWIQVLEEGVDTGRKSGVIAAEDLQAIRWSELKQALAAWHKAKRDFDGCRHQSWPWILNPAAWRARANRQHWWKFMQSLKADVLQRADGPR